MSARSTSVPKSRRSRVARSLPDWISVADSGIHGRGIYARKLIPDGVPIVEYTGERISKAESRERERARRQRQREGGDSCVYIFELDAESDLDGSGSGNVARLMNHSCAPNCRAETIHGHIWLLARRDIVAGEELTFDYGYAFREWPLHPCRCGALRCPGFIVNAVQRWRLRRIPRAERLARSTAALAR